MVTLNLNQVTVETEHLLLIPITEKYREDIFREFTDEVTKYMTPPTPKDISETDQFIAESKRKREAREEIVLTILDKSNEKFLGICGIHDINTKTPEFGIWLKVGAQHKGLGKEVVAAMKDWTDKNVDYDYIRYPVAVENKPSRALPESLGRAVTEEYDVTNPAGKILHEVEYRIYKNN